MLFRMWMTVIVFGKFYRLLMWRGIPEEFVLGDIVSWGLLEFEYLDFQKGGGWTQVAVPVWAIDQVYDKTVKER